MGDPLVYIKARAKRSSEEHTVYGLLPSSFGIFVNNSDVAGPLDGGSFFKTNDCTIALLEREDQVEANFNSFLFLGRLGVTSSQVDTTFLFEFS